jgi:signal transduction histidine kinase
MINTAEILKVQSKTIQMTRFSLYILLFFSSIAALKAHDTSYQNKLKQVNNLLDSSNSYFRSDFTQAHHFAQTALKLSVGLNSTYFKVKSLSRIGQIFEHHVRYAEAKPYYQSAFEIAQTQADDSLKISSAIEWAGISTVLYDFETAFKVYQNALEKSEKRGDKYLVAWVLNDLGLLYEKSGHPEKSIEASLKSVSISESVGDYEQAAISLGNVIKTYTALGNYNLALQTINRLHHLADASKKPYRMGSALNVHGSILAAMNRYDEALKQHLEALVIYEKLGDKRYLIRTYNHLENLYLRQKNYLKAEETMNHCLSYADYFDDEDRATLYNRQGKLYQATNRFEAAIQAFERAIVMASKNNMFNILQGSHRHLARIYEHKQLTDKAYAHLLAATVFSDSLAAKEQLQHLAEAQFKNNLERSEREIKELKEQKTRNWIVTVVVLLFVSLFAMSVIAVVKRKAHLALIQQKAEIERQNERLETTNETLRQFAYASAHDLKEPLRSIGSFIKIIEKRYVSQLPAEANEYMGFVTGGVKRMENLLSALLEYATLASDAPLVVTNQTALTAVLDDVNALLIGIVNEKQAIITRTGDFPSLFVNRVHLTQVIQNLMSNAMKFSTNTPIIDVHGQIQDEQFVLTLKDNGIGIKKEYSNKVFRLFQRLNKTTQYEGTGIGLAMCKQIVEKYGGKIWFESEEGKGTTFLISFPMSVVKQTPTEIVKHKKMVAYLS